jgi:hypothetical protein
MKTWREREEDEEEEEEARSSCGRRRRRRTRVCGRAGVLRKTEEEYPIPDLHSSISGMLLQKQRDQQWRGAETMSEEEEESRDKGRGRWWKPRCWRFVGDWW